MNRTINKIKISIYDDHASVRESYKRWLSASGFEVVFDSGELDRINDDIKKYKPHIILMDIDFPDKSGGGINACEMITRSFPDIKVVFITHYNEPEIVISAFKAGATGYFSKSDELKFLREIIEKAYNNYISISPTPLKSLLKSSTEIPGINPNKPGIDFHLTDEEIKTLIYIARGLSNKEIARKLLTNEKKIKNITSNILLKIGARNRANAVAIAIAFNIIHPDDIFSSHVDDLNP